MGEAVKEFLRKESKFSFWGTVPFAREKGISLIFLDDMRRRQLTRTESWKMRLTVIVEALKCKLGLKKSMKAKWWWGFASDDSCVLLALLACF